LPYNYGNIYNGGLEKVMKIQNSRSRIILTAMLIALGLISLLFVSGCFFDKPEKVVEKFFKALYDGDSGTAQKYCTARALDQDLSNGDNAFTTLRDDHTSGDNNFISTRLVSDVRGNTAEVWSRDEEDIHIILIKTGGTWKIDEFELSASSNSDRNNDNADNNRDEANNDNNDNNDEADNNENNDDNGNTGRHPLRDNGD